MSKDRMVRINELIKQELSLLLSEKYSGSMITITRVFTLADLSLAKIYFTLNPFQESLKQKIIADRNYFWRELSEKISLRKMPKLELIYDENYAEIAHIEELIELIKD